MRATAAFAAALYLYERRASFLSRCPTLGQPLPLPQTRSLAVALWCGAVGNSWLLVSRSRTLPHPWPTRTRLTSSGSAATAGTMTPPASILLQSGTGITRLAAPMIRSLSLLLSLSLSRSRSRSLALALSLSLSGVVLVVWRHVSQDIPFLSVLFPLPRPLSHVCSTGMMRCRPLRRVSGQRLLVDTHTHTHTHTPHTSTDAVCIAVVALLSQTSACVPREVWLLWSVGWRCCLAPSSRFAPCSLLLASLLSASSYVQRPLSLFLALLPQRVLALV